MGETDECFAAMCLDNKLGLIAADILDKGTIDAVEIHPRRLVDFALTNKPAYIVLLHNHPSGDTIISDADITTTTHIAQIFEPFNIIILDHIVVTGNNFISFSQNNVLSSIRGVENAKRKPNKDRIPLN
ncbi:MAG: hypothetical protein FWE33_06855 [Defluviitaleaceae bacterium]|nr:hypothetical protein [Defluviitaleaceae bacterium]